MSCVREPQNKSYIIGRKMEIYVASVLAAFGWRYILSPGSRGPADIISTKGIWKLCIQVKHRNSQCSSNLKFSEYKKLIKFSKRNNGIPVLAYVTKEIKKFLSVPIYFRNRQNASEIVDICGNLIAIELPGGAALTLYNLSNGKKLGYDKL